MGYERERQTAMDNSMDIVEIGKTFQNTHGDSGNDLDLDRTNFFVDGFKGAAIHELHADADVGIGEVGAVTLDYEA